jgi:hypothetical protein
VVGAAAQVEGGLEATPGLPERALRQLRCPECAAHSPLCCAQCHSAFYCSAEHFESGLPDSAQFVIRSTQCRIVGAQHAGAFSKLWRSG